MVNAYLKYLFNLFLLMSFLSPTLMAMEEDSFTPKWIKFLNLPEETKKSVLKKLSQRATVTIAKKEGDKITHNYGYSLHPEGYFHELFLGLLRDFQENTKSVVVREIGGGCGYAAADMALTISQAVKSNGKFVGKVLVCEPNIPDEANKYIFDFLEGFTDKRGSLYKVSPKPFPACLEKLNSDSVFNLPPDLTHCMNVIHFLSPAEADLFFPKVFDVKPGAYVCLATKAPQMSIDCPLNFQEVAVSEADKVRGAKLIPLAYQKAKGNYNLKHPLTSILEYYRKREEKGEKYSGYCEVCTFYFDDSGLNEAFPGLNSSIFGNMRLNEGCCFLTPPTDETPQYLEEACDATKTPFIIVQRAIMNYFSAKQLSNFAKNFGMNVIEAGYMNGSLPLKKLPNLEDDIPETTSTAYIIAQKPPLKEGE